MKLPPLAYIRPSTVAEAVALLSGHAGEALVIAGGQSLIPILAFRLAAPALLVDIGHLPELRGVHIGPEGVRLGALTRWREIGDSEALAAAHPLLVAAVSYVAHYQIRNRGTVGGSLAHADPAAELPGIAIACDAAVEVTGPEGDRKFEARDFFIGPLTTALEPGDLVTALHLPVWPQGRRWGFQEFSRRRGDFALAGAAAFYDLDSEGRAVLPHVAVIGVSGVPRRLGSVERMLGGRVLDEATIVQAGLAVGEAVEPMTDLHAEGEYRRALAATLVERALRQATERGPA